MRAFTHGGWAHRQGVSTTILKLKEIPPKNKIWMISWPRKTYKKKDFPISVFCGIKFVKWVHRLLQTFPAHAWKKSEQNKPLCDWLSCSILTNSGLRIMMKQNLPEERNNFLSLGCDFAWFCSVRHWENPNGLCNNSHTVTVSGCGGRKWWREKWKKKLTPRYTLLILCQYAKAIHLISFDHSYVLINYA